MLRLPLSQPIKRTTKINHDLLACIFPHLAPAACFCIDFMLLHCGFSSLFLVHCDWFYDAHSLSSVEAPSVERRQENRQKRKWGKERENGENGKLGMRGGWREGGKGFFSPFPATPERCNFHSPGFLALFQPSKSLCGERRSIEHCSMRSTTLPKAGTS